MHNPILKKMGYGPKDRVVVFHADDVGMCETTLISFAELLDFGIVSSGSVMVPCPGFESTAHWAQQNSQADLGVHLTLTSEWDTYRWGPVTSQNQDSGILDEEGYFYKSCLSLWQNARLDRVYDELKGQINRAQSEGMNITHLDAHMFSCMPPDFFEIYYTLGQEFNIPTVLKRGSWSKQDPTGLNNEKIEEAENSGLPVFDHYVINSLHNSISSCFEATRYTIDSLKPGLTYYIIHPAMRNDEITSIAHDWQGRDADYRVFKSKKMKKYISDAGIHIVSFRDMMIN